MQCPLVAAFLQRLRADLGPQTINHDLLDEARELEAQEPTGTTQQRLAFCCRVVLDRFASKLLKIPNDAPCRFMGLPILRPDDVNDMLETLRGIAQHYDIEVAEYKMGNEQRDAAQLTHNETTRGQNAVHNTRQLLMAARDGNGEAAGDHFYWFMYRDLQDTEALVGWARVLVEMKHGERA